MQEEVCDVWLEWCYKIAHPVKRRRVTNLGLISVSEHALQPADGQGRNSAFMDHYDLGQLYTRAIPDVWDRRSHKQFSASYSSMPQSHLSRHILTRSMPDFPPVTMSTRNARGMPDAPWGLSPPPRTARNRSKSPGHIARASLSRIMPSLTAFKTHSEEDEWQQVTRTEESRGEASFTDATTSSQSVVSRFYARPPTAHSSRTFGIP